MPELLLLLVAFTVFEAFRRLAPRNFVFAVSGDEDMKIVDGHFSAAPTGEDTSEAEAAAQAYLRQKSAGNVDKARVLGEQFAATLREKAEELAPGLTSDDEQLRLTTHHKLLLFSYVVNRVIADLSPNSILAQTTLNVFYDATDAADPKLAEHIRDMAGFSLYILCERSESCREDEIGRIYARLCGSEESKATIDEGNRLYRDWYTACTRLHEQADYKKV